MQLSQALFKGSHATMQTTQRRYQCATALRLSLEGWKMSVHICKRVIWWAHMVIKIAQIVQRYWLRFIKVFAFECYIVPTLYMSHKACCKDERLWKKKLFKVYQKLIRKPDYNLKMLCPAQSFLDISENGNFLLQIRFPSTCKRRFWAPKPGISKTFFRL